MKDASEGIHSGGASIGIDGGVSSHFPERVSGGYELEVARNLRTGSEATSIIG